MLLDLHQRYHILDQAKWSKIDTLHADIASAQEGGRLKRMQRLPSPDASAGRA